MEILLIIVGMIILLLLQGFFSGSEIAMVHADRLRLRHLANQGNRSALLILKLFRKPEILLGTTLVGTNLSLVTLTTLGTLLMIKLFGEHGDLLAALIYTPLFLIFGEIVPKSVYQQKADFLGLIIIYPLRFFSWLFYPIVFVFSWVARRVARLAGVDVAHRELFTNREQIKNVIEMAEHGADIDVFDRDRITRVVRFAELTVNEVMIPITDVKTLHFESNTHEAIHLARKQSHFRLPVFKDSPTKIIGVVSFTMWELMDPAFNQKTFEELIHPPEFVKSSQLLDEILPTLQKRRDHVAIVIDDEENAIGMITLEDVLKEVVGEVMNVGYTYEQYLPKQIHRIKKLPNGTFLIDGDVSIVELSGLLGTTLTSTEAHTAGGMVSSELEHLPEVGDNITQAGFNFIVEKLQNNEIQKLRIVPYAKN